jgi:hypothetical protein
MAAAGIRRIVLPVNELPSSWQEQPERGPIYTLEMQSHDFWVWRNNYAKPYVYIATRFQTAPDLGTVERRLRALTMDRVNEAQVYDPAGSFPPDVQGLHTGIPPTEAEVGSVKIERYAPGDVEISLTTEQPRLLVLNEGYNESWRATVNGQPAHIYPTNSITQGVVVSPGTHRVRYYYDPPLKLRRRSTT